MPVSLLVQEFFLAQFEKLSPFDGTMAYAQNKRQQVVMTEVYAKVRLHSVCYAVKLCCSEL